jgi:MFS family permease
MTAALAIAGPRPAAARPAAIWIVLCGSLIVFVGFGPRSALGFCMTPVTLEHGWGRDTFAFALAIQNLLWGVGQPIAGAFADRFGAPRVLIGGALLYAAGLTWMAHADTPLAFLLSAGVLVGFGLSGASFNIVLAAFGRLVPERFRSLAFGIGAASGSFGQFFYSPLAVMLTAALGWQATLVLFAAGLMLVMPLSLALVSPRPAAGGAGLHADAQPSPTQALRQALRHPSYIFLVLGFVTCGFQLAFITVHLPAYLADKGLSVDAGAWTIAVIGLFNIAGAIGSGWLGGRMPRRMLLAAIYAARAAVMVVFLWFPLTPASAIAFGAATGLLWLSTVPLTSGLVALMFGTRWFGTLYGLAFFGHQIGSFLGVWLGGVVFEASGSYDIVWHLAIVLAAGAAMLNLLVAEKPLARPAMAAA